MGSTVVMLLLENTFYRANAEIFSFWLKSNVVSSLKRWVNSAFPVKGMVGSRVYSEEATSEWFIFRYKRGWPLTVSKPWLGGWGLGGKPFTVKNVSS